MRSSASKQAGALALALAIGMMPLFPVAGQAAATAHAGATRWLNASPQAAELRIAMRELWEDHVLWTRLVIVSTAANLPDLDATTQRLLRNQADLGNAVKPFYGDAAGEKLTGLLRMSDMISEGIVKQFPARFAGKNGQ